MNDITIQYNMASELVQSVMRYICNDELNALLCDLNNNREKANPAIVRWVDMIDEQISPFLKNDLILIKRVTEIDRALIHLIFRNHLETPEQLLNLLKTISGASFVQAYLEYFKFNWDGHSAIRAEDLRDAFAGEVEDPEDQKFILDMIHSPEELKDRIRMVLESFYSKFFKDTADRVKDVLQEKIASHTTLFASNPELFTKAFLVMSYSDYTKAVKDSNLKVYISYYNELSIAYNSTLNIVTYGIEIEQRYNHEIDEYNQKQIFKTLSEEKRVEILKLLAQRQWYGNELAKEFQLTTATMSYHISRLAELGLISITSGEQNRFYYRLEKERVKELILGALRDIIGED